MKTNIWKSLRGMLFFGLLLAGIHQDCTYAATSPFSSVPLNSTGNNATPLVMINTSRDHQLSSKAYNDYSDLGLGQIETTYQDKVDYYGYFDNKKCYTYSATAPTANVFVPTGLATGVNKHYCSGQWSGNFLNWSTMTRMDTVRKLLYGGFRSTDTNALTILERQYLPTEAHAFAKYYNGSDIASLTPFSTIATTPTPTSSTTSRTIPTSASTLTFATTLAPAIGDQVKVFRTNYETSHWMIGMVTATSATSIDIKIPANSYAGTGTYNTWTVQDLSKTGISLCNLTLGASSGVNRYSDTNTNPPLIRVAQGNFALWNANERWQCHWYDETNSKDPGGIGSNGNRAAISGLSASAENPKQTTHGLGTGSAQGEYIARVQACASDALIGEEKCKKYGSSTYSKPIGLLQVYGDTNQIQFGMMTGSYSKNISGGVLRKAISSFADEINAADGTFLSTAKGIVYNFNKLRIYGYDYNDGTYIGHDNCNFQQTGLALSGGSTTMGQPANQGNCSSWGNPMSEIYLESLRYLAGKTASTTDFTYGTGSKDATLGLTAITTWTSPLDANNYCAPLNVLNFNASVSTNDDDQMGTSGGTNLTDLNSSTTTAQSWTNWVGTQEPGITSSSWFIGNNGLTYSAMINDQCTAKPIGSGFGSFSGLCSEAPTQHGSYLMSGLAYYANTHRIRSDLTVPTSRQNSHDLKVSTYGIALSTNVPKIDVKVGTKTVTILPAYRLDMSSAGTGPFGSGTIVDFKIVYQGVDPIDGKPIGKFYVNWEDSEMGGDYDQDVWGIISYKVDPTNSTITVTTQTISQSTANGQGFGYVISGTNHDGVHFHSGILNFDYVDPTGVLGCSNCNVTDNPTSVTYTATGTSGGLLKDPLWYAAKWGGFTDQGFVDNNTDKNPTIGSQSQWDQVNNTTGVQGPDGVPDNYFLAINPLQLENSLNRVFLSVLERASSGTAAAVVSNNVSGIGALYQAYYEPLRQDASNNKVSWIGTIQGLWLDSFGNLREERVGPDGSGNVFLEGYQHDPVIDLFYDETQNKTQVRRYESTRDDVYTPNFMQGEVISLSPLTFNVRAISGIIGAGPFIDWTVSNLTTGETGTSSTSASIVAVTSTPTTQTFALSAPAITIKIGDTVKLAHFNSSIIPLEQVGTIWNARRQLSTVNDPTKQRDYTTMVDPSSADGGRYIMTWMDTLDSTNTVKLGGDGVVQANEFLPFNRNSITSANFRFLNVATQAEAQDLVDYIRGAEFSKYRSRKIDYDRNGTTEIMRLGDIVNSTPTVVGSPQENFDLLYGDTSYTAFKTKYANRRQVLYAGSNDGMLHAFNGGFYDNSTLPAFLVSRNGENAHPLGSELWAYVPMNVLPHLKYLADIQYVNDTHVYFVDGKPKVFDAKIFSNDPPTGTHPGGWGTVLVVGMRFGGGATAVTVNSGSPADTRTFSSAYIIIDITDPEQKPTLLAEIKVPDGSFSTGYPTIFTVKDKISALDNNKWFLSFGSGPTNTSANMASAASTTSAQFYALDLGEIASPGTSSSGIPSGGTCSKIPVGTGGSMRILSCSTGVAASFTGDFAAVDWNLDYKADSVYFGLVGDNNANTGQVMRLDTNGNDNPANWTAPTTFINTAQPVVGAVTPGIDETNQRWIFFGTGRYFVKLDQTNSTAQQAIYGVKEMNVSAAVDKTLDLINVTDAQVATNGTLTTAVGTNTTFAQLQSAINLKKGWYLNLPTIQGTQGVAPATRVFNQSALAGGVLSTSAYQPNVNLCTGEGFSRLYGLYYKTGTAYPKPTVFGTEIVSGVTRVKKFIELGYGVATTPALYSGSGTGSQTVDVFTQLSTGAIIRTEANTVLSVRSGMESWSEQR